MLCEETNCFVGQVVKSSNSTHVLGSQIEFIFFIHRNTFGRHEIFNCVLNQLTDKVV